MAYINGKEILFSPVVDGYESGKQAQENEFWETFQNGGNRFAYDKAFIGLYDSGLHYGWNDEIYNPKHPIKLGKEGYTQPVYGQQVFYYNTEITDTKVDIEVYVDTLLNTFVNAYNLKTIRKLKFMREGIIFSGTFSKCQSLENLTIEGTIGANGLSLQWSTKLSHDSIVSVVNALSTTTTGLSVTLSLTAVKNAFETSTGAADGNTSAEWTALIATRSNWTISLV